MHRLRKSFLFLRGWLALSLILSPLLAVQAAPPAPVVADTQVVSAMDPDRHASHAQHADQGVSHPNCQAQHDCQGTCCSQCGHCAGVVALSVESLSDHRPVMKPSIPKLASFPELPRRDRPPRLSFA